MIHLPLLEGEHSWQEYEHEREHEEEQEQDEFASVYVSNAFSYNGQMTTKLQIEGGNEEALNQTYVLRISQRQSRTHFTRVKGEVWP